MELLSVAVALLLAGLLLLWTALAAWQRREAPGSDLFALAAGSAGAAALAVAASIALSLPREVALASTVVVGLVFPVPWLLFSFAYTGRNDLVSPGAAAAVAAVPVTGLLATGLIFGSRLVPWLTLPARDAATGLAAVTAVFLNMVQWLALLYTGGVMLVGSGVVLWTFHRYEHLDSTAGTLLGVFGTVPWISVLFGLQVSEIEPIALPGTVAVGFLAGGLAAAGSLERYQLFRNVPAAGNVGPATVVEELEDVMVVTDSEETVVEANAAAEQALDAAAAEVIGADLEAVLDVSLGDLRETTPIELQSVSGRCLFEPTVSELTDQHGHRLGYAIVLRDVTARNTRQQRLEVLNRVLRHNLRNDMNVISGRAELIRRNADDPELAQNAQCVLRNARGLNRLSEEAREIDRVMATVGTASESVSLAPLAEEVLDAAAAGRRAVTADVAVPEGIAVRSSEEVLRLALENLVDNAIEHNDIDAPYVGIRASYDADRTYPVTVSVDDDGPGIPDTERRVIERGDENSLQHGSSLGLWVVRWAVTRLGGEIDFERREPRGMTVTLRLPGERRSEVGADATPDGVRR